MRFATANETPLVSVCILTYNHEKWIRSALDSVLMQVTDFPCEVIIAEDCSTDSTRDIILSYADKYPFKLILQKKNKGVMPNLKDLVDSPIGKYIAYLEGDDSWIDPLKLQKQVDVLEKDETISLCYANSKMYDTVNPDSNIFFKKGFEPPLRKDKYNMIVACPAPACTLVFRNKLKPYPEWALKARAGDHLMVSMMGKYGDAYYIDECLGLYNHDYTGLSRVIGQEHYLYDDFLVWQNLEDFYEHEPKAWDAVVQRGYCDIDKLFHRGWPDKAKALFRKWPLRKVWKVKRLRLSIIKMAIKLHFPFMIKFKKQLQ